MRTITANFWEFPGGPVVKDPTLSLLWHRSDPWPRNKIFRELKEKKTIKYTFIPSENIFKRKGEIKKESKRMYKI